MTQRTMAVLYGTSAPYSINWAYALLNLKKTTITKHLIVKQNTFVFEQLSKKKHRRKLYVYLGWYSIEQGLFDMDK